MKTFESVAFRGTFRDYQQKVLDNMQRHLQNGKIHIVAAPGSGKTVLGLELIRRLGSPALVFSPSVTIRQQWGERFEEKFLPQGCRLEDYFSCDLKSFSAITSVTYQALHAAWNRLAAQAAGTGAPAEEGDAPETDGEDFSQFDLVSAVRAAGIRTICLDEAHHLRSEWQKALEGFVAALRGEVTVIALTATPPYDSTPGEWNRYISLCGEIDDEIFVPQLVAQGTLCPHQDYVYFNYPTEEEAAALKDYKEKAVACVWEILSGPLFAEIIESSGLLRDYESKSETILDNAKGFIALLCLAQAAGREIPEGLVQLLCPGGRLPAFSLGFAETAFEFVLGSPAVFPEATAEKLRQALSQRGLIERKKVRLVSSEAISRSLLSSMGKLESITKIVEAESEGLGTALRMLILTDYIKKDMLRVVGTDEPIRTVGTVTIFEAVRRSLRPGLHAAVLSGNLVILPDAAVGDVRHIAEARGIRFSSKAIGFTGYSEITFDSTNKGKVAVMTEAFRRGHIHILIGTKSLLGEGWDSPCINSLILASFVGSFVLSNQMRGRAIRVDPENPGKVSNIWHLVTVEPPLLVAGTPLEKLFGTAFEDKSRIYGDDYETLTRRFECFLAPSYDGRTIESGIERAGIIKPPYDRKGIARINDSMLKQAEDRAALAGMWKGAVSGCLHPEVLDVSQVPAKVLPTKFLFINALNEAFFATALVFSVRCMLSMAMSTETVALSMLFTALSIVFLVFLIMGTIKLLRHISPKKTIETLGACLLNALRETGEIESAGAALKVESYAEDMYIVCSVSNATAHEKNVFAKAVGEMLTSIENPRYLLIRRSRFLLFTWSDYAQSYACPAVLAGKKETVDVFAAQLSRLSGKFNLVYTRSEAGRAALLKCRRFSYINRNDIAVQGRKVAVSKWE